MRTKRLLFVLSGLLIGTGLGLAVFLLIPGMGSPSSTSRHLPPTVGSPAPDFELNTLDGPSQKLSGLRGKAVVVNFWATWCPPCKEEIPLLERTARQYPDRLIILGLDSREEEKVVRPFAEQLGMRYPVLMDTAGLVTNLYFVNNFPMTFFIDSNGILRAQHLGLLTEADLAKYLKTVGISP